MGWKWVGIWRRRRILRRRRTEIRRPSTIETPWGSSRDEIPSEYFVPRKHQMVQLAMGNTLCQGTIEFFLFTLGALYGYQL